MRHRPRDERHGVAWEDVPSADRACRILRAGMGPRNGSLVRIASTLLKPTGRDRSMPRAKAPGMKLQDRPISEARADLHILGPDGAVAPAAGLLVAPGDDDAADARVVS